MSQQHCRVEWLGGDPAPGSAWAVVVGAAGEVVGGAESYQDLIDKVSAVVRASEGTFGEVPSVADKPSSYCYLEALWPTTVLVKNYHEGRWYSATWGRDADGVVSFSDVEAVRQAWVKMAVQEPGTALVRPAFGDVVALHR